MKKKIAQLYDIENNIFSEFWSVTLFQSFSEYKPDSRKNDEYGVNKKR
jgi:hypothetical protein